MKKSVTIVLFIFFVICTAIITAGLLSYSSKKNQSLNQPATGAESSTINSSNSSADVLVPSALTLTSIEVTKHNSANDCWMIINGKVYDVTKAISAHPGGASPILKYCGKDGTIGFQTKDIGSSHSSTANNMLTDYLLGNLGQSVTSQTIKKETTNQPAAASKPATVAAPLSLPVTAPPSTPVSSSVVLTSAEVAKHNTASNCWMIINNKVYNFTAFIPSHPGGSAMVPYCGKDGTIGFQTKDKNPGSNHSGSAYSLLATYLLGDLNQSVNSQSLEQTVNQQNSTPAPSGSNNEREDEDEENFD
jgi:cytochrome b involved in lipid metabolism